MAALIQNTRITDYYKTQKFMMLVITYLLFSVSKPIIKIKKHCHFYPKMKVQKLLRASTKNKVIKVQSFIFNRYQKI